MRLDSSQVKVSADGLGVVGVFPVDETSRSVPVL